jgi:hypothetical protein
VGAAVFGLADAVAWADSTSPSGSAGTSVSAGPATGRAVNAGVSRPKATAARTNKPAAAQTTRRVAVAPPAVAVSVSPASASTGSPAATEAPLDLTVMPYSRQATVTAASTTVSAAAALTQPVIMGPSGVPIPSPFYVSQVMNYYVRQPSGAILQPPYEDPQPQVIFTPEGLYPITGVKSLPLNTSVDQGIHILSDTLEALPAGTPTTVFGYSQSAIISGLLQDGFTVGTGASAVTYTVPANIADSVNFVLVGNELNPDGGLLSRFTATDYAPALSLPSLGLDFYGATPPQAFDTTNYTLEYDGFADFPRYPLNFLADLNAGLGLAFVHTKYAPGQSCKSYCTTLEQVQTAIPLPTLVPAGSTVVQNYFFMPTDNLPLVEPLRMIPIIGNPIADLIQPVLKAIVDLGYGDAAHGYASGGQPFANQLVPFGLFPQVDPLEVVSRLINGVGEGITAFVNDFTPTGSIARELSALSAPNLSSLALPTPDGLITGLQNLITKVTGAIGGSTAALYAGLLPTADLVNAIVVALPGYDASLFLGGIKQMMSGDLIGGLVNAIGLPIAADVGLVTTASLVGALAWAQSIAGFFGINLTA